MEFMPSSTTQARLGDTERVTNPDRTGVKGSRFQSDPVRRTHEQNASHLREVVELARQANAVQDPAKRESSGTELDQALGRRQQFWLDTCREVTEMRSASRHVLDLHRKHGCRFCAPSPQQAQYILDALDSALPSWDRDHPELFYQTMELNFPELLRVRLSNARY